MKNHLGARRKKSSLPLTEVAVFAELARILPKKNRYGQINAAELVDEARDFGIVTRGAFRKLMLRHRKTLLEIDRAPLDSLHERIFAEDYGAEIVREFQRRQYWFSWEGLVRTAFELEFGEAYERYSYRRDGIVLEA
jgi:CBS domain-containing protein